MLSGIIQSIIASIIILIVQWIYKKYKENKSKSKKNNFVRNTAIISITLQFLTILGACLSIYFFHVNKSGAFSICLTASLICFEQAVINTYALYLVAKHLEESL